MPGEGMAENGQQKTCLLKQEEHRISSPAPPPKYMFASHFPRNRLSVLNIFYHSALTSHSQGGHAVINML